MIEFMNVSKAFGSKIVLNDISFRVGSGEIVFVIGKSGMGKSVLLKNIVGLIEPDSGKIFVNEKQVTGLSEEEFFEVRRYCGMIFQLPALLDSLNIFENMAFGLQALKLVDTEEELEDVILTNLSLVNLREDVLTKFPQELSYGMQKRVSLARTLALKPKYLLFDEPTTSLDPVSTHTINDLIFRLSRKLNVTSIVVSHDMHCAIEIADRVFLLDEGKIVFEGPPAGLKESTLPLVKEFMIDALAKVDDNREGE